MMIHMISIPELNQDLARAKRAALERPVYITDKGRSAHVLMSFAQYQRRNGGDAILLMCLPCRACPRPTLSLRRVGLSRVPPIRPDVSPYTNLISGLRKARDGMANIHVTTRQAAQDANALFISAITVVELEIGLRRIARRDQRQGALLRAWFTGRVLPEFEGRVLPIDGAVALRCAGLHVSDPRAERDALIAATALVHGLTVVTRNTGDFRETGADLLNPWDGG